MAFRTQYVGLLLCALAGCGDDSGDSPAPDASTSGSETGNRTTGCATTARATSYRATAAGSVAEGAAASVTPCLSLTGFGANEPRVGVARDGTIYFGPAFGKHGNGVASSKDQGLTWTQSVPKFADGGGHPKLQPFFYLDPSSDRLFFSTSKLVLNGLMNFKDDPGIHLSVSADSGKSWQHQALAPECRDWQKIFTGPPVTSPLQDYPRVVYFSVPSPIAGNWAGIFPPPDFQHFYRSLDGGKTFSEVSKIPIAPKVVEGCIPGDFAMFGQGAVLADGTIALSFRRCQQLAVAVSKDEGETWEYHDVPGAKLPPYDTSSLLGILSIIGGENAITGEPIAVDSEGNFYAVWTSPDNLLFYATSQDRGTTWTTPVQVLAPGVQTARMVAITAKTKGRVAIAYFGSKDGTAFDGYMAESLNGLDAEPVFSTATANDPSEPLYPRGWQSGYDPGYFDNGGDEITLIQILYDQAGDLYASFVKDMCPEGDRSACTWDYEAHGQSRFQGALGRLVHAK